MKLRILGNGAFGSFLKELLASHFELTDSAESVILAVPFSAYEEVCRLNKNKHLINVCSVQKPTTDTCLKYSDRVTSIHPLFGRRTPSNKRFTIWTYSFTADNDTWLSQVDLENEFHNKLMNVTEIHTSHNGKVFTPELHDVLMAKTHLAATIGAKQLKILVDRAKDTPDFLSTNSFRLMRDFVKTLEDMPAGTMESILANPYG